MFRLDKYNVKINIKLENGIYTFDRESSTGKTRLYKVLRQYQSVGEPVSAYTYQDKKLGIPIESVIDSSKFKLIMLDRYDMYNGDAIELIKKHSKNSIILIDCKLALKGNIDDNWCYIEMTPDLIEVLE